MFVRIAATEVTKFSYLDVWIYTPREEQHPQRSLQSSEHFCIVRTRCPFFPHTANKNCRAFSCAQVGDGQAALDGLASGRFDLLVLDLGLPKKSGMEVLTELRAMPPESAIHDIPVIVSSGHVLDEHRKLCLEAG